MNFSLVAFCTHNEKYTASNSARALIQFKYPHISLALSTPPLFHCFRLANISKSILATFYAFAENKNEIMCKCQTLHTFPMDFFWFSFCISMTVSVFFCCHSVLYPAPGLNWILNVMVIHINCAIIYLIVHLYEQLFRVLAIETKKKHIRTDERIV